MDERSISAILAPIGNFEGNNFDACILFKVSGDIGPCFRIIGSRDDPPEVLCGNAFEGVLDSLICGWLIGVFIRVRGVSANSLMCSYPFLPASSTMPGHWMVCHPHLRLQPHRRKRAGHVPSTRTSGIEGGCSRNPRYYVCGVASLTMAGFPRASFERSKAETMDFARSLADSKILRSVSTTVTVGSLSPVITL